MPLVAERLVAVLSVRMAVSPQSHKLDAVVAGRCSDGSAVPHLLPRGVQDADGRHPPRRFSNVRSDHLRRGKDNRLEMAWAHVIMGILTGLILQVREGRGMHSARLMYTHPLSIAPGKDMAWVTHRIGNRVAGG